MSLMKNEWTKEEVKVKAHRSKEGLHWLYRLYMLCMYRAGVPYVVTGISFLTQAPCTASVMHLCTVILINQEAIGWFIYLWCHLCISLFFANWSLINLLNNKAYWKPSTEWIIRLLLNKPRCNENIVGFRFLNIILLAPIDCKCYKLWICFFLKLDCQILKIIIIIIIDGFHQ